MKWWKIVGVMRAVIVGGSFALLFALGRLPNAGRMQASTEIDAPAAKVWAFLDNEQNMKQWVSWLVDVNRSGPRGAGSTLTVTMKDENNGGQIMRIESRCTEYVPGSRITESMNAPDFDGTQSYRLTDLGNGRTRLEVDGSFHFSQWFANLMTPLIMPAAKSKLEGDLGHLKELVEKMEKS
jgi:uncharacterized protein YndB with AHSA1/START domain